MNFYEENGNRIVITILIIAIMSTSIFTLKLLPGSLWLKQLTWSFIGLSILLISTKLSRSFFYHYSYIIYILAVILLTIVLFFGTRHFGATRWIQFGIINFQPSEIAKPAIILAVSRYLADHQEGRPLRFINFFIVSIMILLPALLVMAEPDLGTSIVILSLFLMVIFVAGIDKKLFLVLIVTSFSAMPLIWELLKGYQKARIIDFINPGSDPAGSSFQSLHSEIIIGAGKLFGHIFQPFLWPHFLPQSGTDFFFSIFSYQYGFVGFLFLLLLYWLLLSRFIKMAASASDNFSRYFIVGFTILLSISLFFNIDMTIGMLPVVGITLPLASYGGSSIIANMVSIGIIISK